MYTRMWRLIMAFCIFYFIWGWGVGFKTGFLFVALAILEFTL